GTNGGAQPRGGSRTTTRQRARRSGGCFTGNAFVSARFGSAATGSCSCSANRNCGAVWADSAGALPAKQYDVPACRLMDRCNSTICRSHECNHGTCQRGIFAKYIRSAGCLWKSTLFAVGQRECFGVETAI